MKYEELHGASHGLTVGLYFGKLFGLKLYSRRSGRGGFFYFSMKHGAVSFNSEHSLIWNVSWGWVGD